MATQIGPLTARIIANSEGMDPGLKQAEQKVQATGRRFAEEGEKAGLGFAKGFALGVAGFAAAGFAGATGTLVKLYKEGSSAIRELAAGAKEANVGLSEFQVVATAIGDINVASNALGEMREKLFEIQVQGGAATGVLASIIPDAFELEAMGTAKAFGVISDRIRELGSRSAQITAVKGVFKKAGEPAMEAILKGSGYLNLVRGRLEGFGADVTEGTYSSLRAADTAMKQLGLLRRGAANQVTIALAPGLAELASRLPQLADLGVTAKGLAEVIVNGAEKLLVGAGKLADAFGAWLEDPWGEFTKAMTEAGNWIMGKFDTFLSKLKDLFEWAIAAMSAGIEKGIKAALDFFTRASLKESEAFLEYSRKVLAEARNRPDAPTSSGGSWATTWSDVLGGLGGNQDFNKFMDEVDRRMQTGGWEGFARSFMAGWRNRMSDLRKGAEENNPFQIWARAAETFAEKLEVPFDKFKAEWLKLQGILKVPGEGFPADAAGIEGFLLNQKIKGRGGFQLLQQLRALSPGGAPGSTFVGAAEMGSREAYSAITQYTSARESLEAEIKRLLEEANEIQKRQEEDGRNAVDILRSLNMKLEVGGF